jgi:hypothetical protein
MWPGLSCVPCSLDSGHPEQHYHLWGASSCAATLDWNRFWSNGIDPCPKMTGIDSPLLNTAEVAGEDTHTPPLGPTVGLILGAYRSRVISRHLQESLDRIEDLTFRRNSWKSFKLSPPSTAGPSEGWCASLIAGNPSEREQGDASPGYLTAAPAPQRLNPGEPIPLPAESCNENFLTIMSLLVIAMYLCGRFRCQILEGDKTLN